MIRRIQTLSKFNSLFLFGARSTGKSTLIRQLFGQEEALWIDLLSEQDEERFGRHPDELSKALSVKKYTRVIIDEIQKSLKLLDIVQIEMEKHRNTQFILTGSSARKLKHGSGNLLGGRAFHFRLFPLTYRELGERFDLNLVLQFGSLPKIFEYNDLDDIKEFLRGYVSIYLKEEVLAEQLVRNLDPFRDFIEIAAQSSGRIINFSKIAREVGVDDKTIKTYYQILEETLVGFYLPPFHRSIRKRQRESPKFFLFDTGVKRAIEKTLRVELLPQTYAYGESFEHFLVSECFRLNEYLKLDFKMSYLRTKDDLEIDLIIERPGAPDLLIEIKSTTRVTQDDARQLNLVIKDWDRDAIAEVWSLDGLEKKEGFVQTRHWKTALDLYFRKLPQST
ncbi:MAG: ATP-binding protein [Bdellovibrionales bacterium]|jgi:predicted AAA+ superfamily ATPase|nr:ATP-binding protein [Bdellovibrionales bacterium]